jgi:hypothetical protein
MDDLSELNVRMHTVTRSFFTLKIWLIQMSGCKHLGPDFLQLFVGKVGVLRGIFFFSSYLNLAKCI